MLEIGQSYHRHDPGGRVTPIDIRNEAEVKYHQSLVDKGYKYEAIRPRIHPGSSVCESCEG